MQNQNEQPSTPEQIQETDSLSMSQKLGIGAAVVGLAGGALLATEMANGSNTSVEQPGTSEVHPTTPPQEIVKGTILKPSELPTVATGEETPDSVKTYTIPSASPEKNPPTKKDESPKEDTADLSDDIVKPEVPADLSDDIVTPEVPEEDAPTPAPTQPTPEAPLN